ncbi:MAG TPA: hypothetical protein VGM92_09360, partial [Candidatus Kapabacteria bacterium]|jgi:hypothetical protein
MPHEAGLWIAIHGQKPLIAPNATNEGFFTNSTIEHFYYSFASSGVQSISFFVEHIDETRGWQGEWATYTSGKNAASYPASVQESIGMTTLGFETTRNFVTLSDFRFGGGIGVGFGLGGTSANVYDSATHLQNSYSSATLWEAFLVHVFLRARYTVYSAANYEIALQVMGRYWSFPFIGPVSAGGEAYNGPSLRAISELGYMAGVAVGF